MTAAVEQAGAGADLRPRPSSYSRVTLARIMEGTDANLYGNVHGGVIMRGVDNAAGAAATRHSGGPAVTAFMDEMAFLEPVRIGDILTVRAQVNWTGRTSMEVGVRVSAQRWDDASADELHVGSAYLVFVAVDGDGRPRPVPPVRHDDERDRRRLAEAEVRRRLRLERVEAIRRLRAQGLDP